MTFLSEGIAMVNQNGLLEPHTTVVSVAIKVLPLWI